MSPFKGVPPEPIMSIFLDYYFGRPAVSAVTTIERKAAMLGAESRVVEMPTIVGKVVSINKESRRVILL